MITDRLVAQLYIIAITYARLYRMMDCVRIHTPMSDENE